jgi:hypothetical protein
MSKAQDGEHKVDNNFETFAGELFGTLIRATKTSNEFPDPQSYKYYTSYTPFKAKMSNFGQRLLDLTQGFLQLEKGDKGTTYLCKLALD